LAARLALAGHKTLLIESGDDQGKNINYTVPAFSARASEDESLAWNFFVRHYADEDRQALDYKTSYETPEGGEYTGLSPPEGSKMKGSKLLIGRESCIFFILTSSFSQLSIPAWEVLEDAQRIMLSSLSTRTSLISNTSQP
jgi:hypothetical protein